MCPPYGSASPRIRWRCVKWHRWLGSRPRVGKSPGVQISRGTRRQRLLSPPPAIATSLNPVTMALYCRPHRARSRRGRQACRGRCVICVSRARASSLLPRLPLSIPFVHFDGVFVRGALRASESIISQSSPARTATSQLPASFWIRAPPSISRGTTAPHLCLSPARRGTSPR